MESLNDGKPPLPPPRKYVSIFHIDGEPILPPLMTTEKRRQMQKLKEKALEIEQNIRQRKQHGEKGFDNEGLTNSSGVVLHNTSSNNSQRSQRSQDYNDNKIKETEQSMLLLQNLIRNQQQEYDVKAIENKNPPFNASQHFHRDENQEKLLKLKKSEIIIYDNSKKEVIQLPAENEKLSFEEQQRILRQSSHKELNYEMPKKPSHLLLAGVNTKGMTSIPAICLNPPTPLMVNRNICESLSGGETSESNPNKSFDLTEELSSDESYNSMITQSDRRSIRSFTKNVPTKPPRCGSVERQVLTPVMPTKNVSAKIQQFEAISSDSNTPQSSPEKLCKPRKSCLGLAMGTMSRSATSPALNLNTSHRSCSSTTQSLAQDSDNSPENNLVRSSSFTLEEPSKALIDHMQQQQKVSTNDSKSATKSPLNTTRSIARKSISSPLRAHRDTVESKAKKVQKVELKSSKMKIQQKASQSKLALAAAASISPYNNTALTQHTNNLCKTKRSPYDLTKTSHTSLQTLQKTSNTQMRKSNSTSFNLVQTKTSKSRPSSATKLTPTSVATNSARNTNQTEQESFNHMEKTQKEKFLRLLAQQEEEHRKLQESFEKQQKMLLEQLNREMAATQLKSPNNSYSSSTTSTAGHGKKQDQRPLSPRLQNQLYLAGLSSDTNSQKPSTPSVDFKHHNSHTSPSTISNNSSSITIAKHNAQTVNFPQTSYGSQYAYSNHLNNSQLCFLDHSNANTSLDISTLSTQTSLETPTTKHNLDNKTNTSSTSSSRRRLFTTEINDKKFIENGNNGHRSSNSSSTDHHMQHAQQTNHINKSPRILAANSECNRRSSVDENSLILHAAATKINACARGFLVRRLFQTEQIQRIVQTIRDTLIFVLNLHLETMENPEESQTPANIKLKARLLQQLSSACRTLHLVFFQTSIKERMEIIARDRKRIKTKLLSMNRRRILSPEYL
ncbi:uncharacterized protein ACRADG_009205 isoform 5-T5 [Cochliomyia hominivorax]